MRNNRNMDMGDRRRREDMDMVGMVGDMDREGIRMGGGVVGGLRRRCWLLLLVVVVWMLVCCFKSWGRRGEG